MKSERPKTFYEAGEEVRKAFKHLWRTIVKEFRLQEIVEWVDRQLPDFFRSPIAEAVTHALFCVAVASLLVWGVIAIFLGIMLTLQ